MSAAKDIFEKLVASGMDVAEALALLSRHAAESVPPTTIKNTSATRQQRYRDRNKSVTERNACDRNETVTNRNETVTSDASLSISSNNSLEERKIDSGERHALRSDFKPSPQAEEIARQKGFAIGEMLAIYRNHLKATGQTSRDYDASFCNFMMNRRTFGDKAEAVAPVIGDQPSLADFDRAAALFVKDNSKWGNRMGPEPGMGGCRCPPEILIKHGIDPKTGMRMQ